MSDSESVAAAPHPTLGGKSLQSIERPRYKSWRKKYRKMRWKFDGSLEDNKRMFKEEQKLECIAKRLREELDGLLDLCLDLNQNPSLPPELRFNVHYTTEKSGSYRRGNDTTKVIPDDITPEDANLRIQEYTWAVKQGQLPHLDLHIMREHADDALAAQEVEKIEELEQGVPHAVAGTLPGDVVWKKGEDGSGQEEPPSGFLTSEQEEVYLDRLDAKLGGDNYNLNSSTRSREQAPPAEEKHWAELTPREVERQAELLNPMSQHNWLRTHVKALAATEGDDNESLASHPDATTKSSAAGSTRKRPTSTKSGLNLARQVGDRAVERAREGWSPSAASGMEEDELVMDDSGVGTSGRKKARDPDGTYRLKGGKSGGGGKGKRKRSGEDVGGGSAGGLSGGPEKKAKVEVVGE